MPAALLLPVLLAASAPAWSADAIRPTDAVIRPFNGRNLDGLVTWLQDSKHEQRLNGIKCNEGFEADPSAGAILIQSELAEVYVRRWELWPLGKAPATTGRWSDN